MVLVRISPELVGALETIGWSFGEPGADGFYAPTVTLQLDVERLVSAVQGTDMARYWREEPRQINDPPMVSRMRFLHREYAEDLARWYASRGEASSG